MEKPENFISPYSYQGIGQKQQGILPADNNKPLTTTLQLELKEDYRAKFANRLVQSPERIQASRFPDSRRSFDRRYGGA